MSDQNETQTNEAGVGAGLSESPLDKIESSAGETLLGGQADTAIAERPLREAVPADAHGWWWGTGRRKAAVARVRIRPASGDKAKVAIQKTRKQFKTVEDYFSEDRDRNDCYAPLKLTDTFGKLEVYIRAHGGGTMGQAQAVRLGIARALAGYDPNFERALREAGYLSRDARRVERKKYGQPGARRRYQFSKR